MKAVLKQIAENKIGFWLALTAILIVSGWRVLAIIHQPAHWREMAAEVAVPQLGDTLMINNSNSGLVYDQNGKYDQNGAFYFYDIAAEKKTLLYERPAKGRNERLYGWSPDDSFFAYSHPVVNYPNHEIFICDGQSGRQLADLPYHGYLTQFAWLSPRSFAYLLAQHLVEVERNQDGKWTQTHVFNNVGQDAKHFTATSANTVAWAAAGKIQGFDLSSGVSKIIWESPTNQLLNFSYSQAGEFVLECRDNNTRRGHYSISFNSPGNWKTEAHIAVMSQNETTENIAAKSSYESALLTNEDFKVFYIMTNANAESIRLPWHGGVAKYALNHGQLFISGNLMNEPGIWRYDIASKSLDQLVSTVEHPFKDAKDASATAEVITNDDGDETGYFLWQPAKISAGKKYPLILCQTDERSPQPLAAASVGCYFALVGREQGAANWAQDIMKVYETLAKNPNIDTNRVFLLGQGEEIGYINQLLAYESNNLWKGVIFLNPAGELDLESLHGKKVFVLTSKKAENVKYLTDYQDKAFAAGIPMTLILLDNEGKTFGGLDIARESSEQLTWFLLQN